jgi:ribosomal protein S18 acetylase RimI-like enzyme
MDDIDIAEEPADSPDVRRCFEQYVEELAVQFGYEPDRALPLDVVEITRPRGLVLVMRDGGSAVGCGALKLIDGGIGEIKRMWVAPEARGHGLGRRILAALEDVAVAEGRTSTRLETNEQLAAALGMYRSRGYREVEPFNTEPFATHWLVKQLR